MAGSTQRVDVRPFVDCGVWLTVPRRINGTTRLLEDGCEGFGDPSEESLEVEGRFLFQEPGGTGLAGRFRCSDSGGRQGNEEESGDGEAQATHNGLLFRRIVKSGPPVAA